MDRFINEKNIDFKLDCFIDDKEKEIYVDVRDIRRMISSTPTEDVVPTAEIERLEKEIKALQAFQDYFSDLYGKGLEIAGWHENGELELFDMFYESAVDEYEAVLGEANK